MWIDGRVNRRQNEGNVNWRACGWWWTWLQKKVRLQLLDERRQVRNGSKGSGEAVERLRKENVERQSGR